MIETLQEITLNMHGPRNDRACVEAQQSDTGSRKVRIHLQSFDGPYKIPADAKVVLYVRKLDGHKVLNDCEIEDESTVLMTLTTQTVACSGRQTAQLYIFNDEGDIKSQSFCINVPRAAYSDDAVQSADEFGALQTATAAADKATRECTEATAECLKATEEISTAARSHASAIVVSASGEDIVLEDSADAELQGLKLFGRTEQDGTPSPDLPQGLVSAGDGGSVSTRIAGRNVWELNESKFVTYEGLTSNINSDGSITISGTPTKAYAKAYNDTNVSLYPGTYFVSGGSTQSGDVMFQVSIVRLDGTTEHFVNKSFTVYGDEQYIRTYMQIGTDLSEVNTVIKPMIAVGSEKQNWEEPKTVSDLTAQTPNGLPGIPVTDVSLANYTDADGQMWCCDEIDFARGVYVQRIGSGQITKVDKFDSSGLLFTNSEFTNTISYTAQQNSIMSDEYAAKNLSDARTSDYAISNYGGSIYVRNKDFESIDEFNVYLMESPIDILYVLATPVETPLSEDVLAAYEALHTNYPVTTILNDAGAGMEIEYQADTKNYIDNRFAELQNAILSMGGNV